jgi:catechol 2,3-dioxygenase-like lactoylglutathione lyase family enzyme
MGYWNEWSWNMSPAIGRPGFSKACSTRPEFYPVVDHVTLRTMDIDRRAEPFLALGYAYDETLNYDDWYAKVYRKAGYPALFVDQAYADARGKTSIIPGWVAAFGDHIFHHIAVRVEDIDKAVNRLKTNGVVFAGQIVGPAGGQLRQIFSAPEVVDGQPFTVATWDFCRRKPIA